MSQILPWIAGVVIILTVYGLVKRWETRMVLIAAGLFLCVISLSPMTGLNQFGKSMTNNSLIMAICGSMGFAFTASYTKCDRSLVYYLATPIRGLGIFLIPVCTAITFFVNIAIPSAAGCAAAVGSTLIPVMLRAGIKPRQRRRSACRYDWFLFVTGYVSQSLCGEDGWYGGH